MQDILEKVIENYGKELQLVVAVEELAELQQAITKLIRKPESSVENLKEEIADVTIMVEQLMIIFNLNLDEICNIALSKIERLKGIMENEI